MRRLHLVHDVSDMQLCNGAGEKIGRVDAVVLEHTSGEPLRVKTILVGGEARQERVGGWSQWLGRLLRHVGGTHERGLSEIPFSAVRRIGDSIVVDVDEKTLPSEHIERWLCERVMRRIPGSDGDRK